MKARIVLFVTSGCTVTLSSLAAATQTLLSFPLYRRMERDVQLMEFKCQPFVEELVYGRFTKQPAS